MSDIRTCVRLEKLVILDNSGAKGSKYVTSMNYPVNDLSWLGLVIGSGMDLCSNTSCETVTGHGTARPHSPGIIISMTIQLWIWFTSIT
jgi:hypothetical protein